MLCWWHLLPFTTTTAALEAVPTLKQQTTGQRQWQSFATSQSIHGWWWVTAHTGKKSTLIGMKLWSLKYIKEADWLICLYSTLVKNVDVTIKIKWKTKLLKCWDSIKSEPGYLSVSMTPVTATSALCVSDCESNKGMTSWLQSATLQILASEEECFKCAGWGTVLLLMRNFFWGAIKGLCGCDPALWCRSLS